MTLDLHKGKTTVILKSIDSWLIQKQHKLYPWLVPMYRTVHRKRPRALVFRAIRWVNPERWFPLMKKNKQDFDDMSDENIKKAIVELNEYRKEALTISNRYDQMISLIERGKLPYRIMWPENKWMTLADRLDRANRLKKGVARWEQQIDKKAIVLRKAMLDKGIRLEDVDEIWQPIPAFKDPKKKYRPLRTTKHPEDPDSVAIASEVEDRGEKYRLPAPEEFREGESQLGHRPHLGHEVAVSLGEFVVRGPVTAKEETPEGEFPGYDVSIQKAREEREGLGLVPEDNWSHGKKTWDTSEIEKVFSSPEESDEPTPKRARNIQFKAEGEGGVKETAVFITTPNPKASDAARMSYLIDRAFGLKVTPRIDKKTIGSEEGYLAEQVPGVDEIDMSDEQWNDVTSNQRARDSLYGIHLLDILTNHPDRHGGNMKYDPTHRTFFSTENEKAFNGGESMEFLKGQVIPTMEIRPLSGDAEQYRGEIEEYFDNHFDMGKVRNVLSEYDLEFNNLSKKGEVLKRAFTDSMMKQVGG